METKQKSICKGFIASVLENKEHGNCSNGGLSEFHREVTIFTEIPECRIFETYPKDELTRPIVIIKKRHLRDGSVYVYAEPIDEPPKGHIGWMMGGCFIYSSDSRFREYFNEYPIPLHDRSETQEDYEVLSR